MVQAAVGAFLLLVTVTAPLTRAISCGNPATKDCINDHRYFSGGNNLAQQSPIWRSGFYRVDSYNVQSDYTTFGEDETQKFDFFPTIGFVNMTVINTRYYMHKYEIVRNKIRPTQSVARYYDMYGHSTFEKDGSALMLDERVQIANDPDTVIDASKYFTTEILPAASSITVPIGSRMSSRRTVLKEPWDGQVTAWEHLTCVEGSNNCEEMSHILETFDGDGLRNVFSSATYVKMSEKDWLAAIVDAYDRYEVGIRYRKSVPMTRSCLVEDFCPSETEWCTHEDPSCSPSPYKQNDGELKPGVVASIVIFSVLFVVFGAYFGWKLYLMLRERRFRTEYMNRFVEDVSLQKALKDMTPENMVQEFNFIDEDKKGHLTKEELQGFLMSTKAETKISDKDFSALWDTMDLNKSGTVEYVEFCAFTADCFREHSILRKEKNEQVKKSVLEKGVSGEGE